VHWVLERIAVIKNDQSNVAAEERLAFASQCLIEANRTLDPEAAHSLRSLASRYFKEADRCKDE
jgi:hypothetical protein